MNAFLTALAQVADTLRDLDWAPDPTSKDVQMGRGAIVSTVGFPWEGGPS